jgi:hypothetical protein
MTRTLDHPLVGDYLRRLEDEARALPRRERTELLDEIRGHLRAELADDPAEHDVRNALDRLGDPREIVAATGVPSRRRRVGALEIVAVVLLLIGAIVIPVLGWFVGLVLLWASAAWTTRQKWLGTLVVPGGLASPLVLGVMPAMRGAVLPPAIGVVLLVALVVGPIVVATYLLRSADRPA